MTLSTVFTIGSLAELLALSDEAFVDAAYSVILGRLPEAEGRAYYLQRIRSGYSKSMIIAQISRSSEARDFSAAVPGLTEFVDNYLKGQRPVIGWLHRLTSRVEGDGPTERKLRAIENRIHVLAAENAASLARLETSVRRLVAQDSARVTDPQGEMHELPEPEQLKLNSAKTRNLYARLRQASRENWQGAAT